MLVFTTSGLVPSPALTPLSPDRSITQLLTLLLLPEKSIASFPIFSKIDFSSPLE